MRVGMLAAIIAASIIVNGNAWAACLTAKHRNCVDFGIVPQITQQIIATEPTVVMPKKTFSADPAKAYTGPTIGTVPNTRRAAEVGYRWAIN